MAGHRTGAPAIPPGSQEAANPLALSANKKNAGVGGRAEGALGEVGIVCCFNPDTCTRRAAPGATGRHDRNGVAPLGRRFHAGGIEDNGFDFGLTALR